jgi:O-6-methylguanine DNA methyltransferase
MAAACYKEFHPGAGYPSFLMISSGSALIDISFLHEGMSAAQLFESRKRDLIREATDFNFFSDNTESLNAGACDFSGKQFEAVILFFEKYFQGAPPRAADVVIETGSVMRARFNCGPEIRMDLRGYGESGMEIITALMKVAPGERISYGELASMAGHPRAARFAGNIMAKNRFPVVIPCHRVVRSDGSQGRYSGGDWIKSVLLEHESAG